MTRKVIVRTKGGLGNQLFCYAAARRLALANDAELVIDHVTGFSRDVRYRRRYALDRFRIPARKATAAERLEPFERQRRGIAKWVSRRKPFRSRRYIEQDGVAFDERLLSLRIASTVYLDGLWPSEAYFKDVEQTIREDLQIQPPTDALNDSAVRQIRNCEAIAVHLRCFDTPGGALTHGVPPEYYARSVALLEREIALPRYFVFSDDPAAARSMLIFPEDRATYVSHNLVEGNAYADLWLMTQCRHFIVTNSTFSWWGAWLGSGERKLVVTPEMEIINGKLEPWSRSVQVPKEWIRL